MLMRDIASVQTLKSNHDAQAHLLDIFKKPTGMIGSKVIDEIPDEQAMDFACQFRSKLYYEHDITSRRIMPVFNRLMKTKYNEMFDDMPQPISKLLKSKYYGDKKERSSKILLTAIGECGVDVNLPAFQKILAKWQASFNTVEVSYKIGWNWKDFDKLGEINGVDDEDSGRSSCYRRQGEWKEAPIILASGFFKKLGTFIVFLKDKDKNNAGRAWGFIEPKHPDCVFLSNGYYADGIPTDIAIFVRCIEAAMEVGVRYKLIGERLCVPLYLNRDAVAIVPLSSDRELDKVSVSIDRPSSCICGNRFLYEERSFCGDCLEQGVECDECGERVNEDDSCYCDSDGQTFCSSCYEDNHTRCCGCSEQVCINDVMLAINRRSNGTEREFCGECFIDWAVECANCGLAFFEYKNDAYGYNRMKRCDYTLCLECEEENSDEEEDIA